MFLYLVRHAEAKSEEEDLLRPLSEKGIEEAKKMAAHLSKRNIRIEHILHSTKLRAKQTAIILSEGLKPAKGASEAEGISPLDDPSKWVERLNEMTEDIMLVGHLPHLERLASLLLCSDMDKDILSIRTAGVVCLEKDGDEEWRLVWMLNPDMIMCD